MGIPEIINFIQPYISELSSFGKKVMICSVKSICGSKDWYQLCFTIDEKCFEDLFNYMMENEDIMIYKMIDAINDYKNLNGITLIQL